MARGDKQRGLWLFTLMLSYYERNCSKLNVHYSHSSKNRCKLLLQGQPQWTKYQGQQDEPEVQRPLCLYLPEKTQAAGKWLHNMVGRFR